MTKSASEIFNTVFEEVIIPVMDKIMKDDYRQVLIGKNELCENETEFMNFRGAFQQRIKLFYFRQFTKYKAEGREKIFPGDIEQVNKDIFFLYLGFKSFLKEQRIEINK